jgi:hypothetical protein
VTEEKHTWAYEKWLDAWQRFDYFIATAALASSGYLITHLPEDSIGLNPSTLELPGIAMAILACYFGLRGIQWGVANLSIMSERAHHDDVARMIQERLMQMKDDEFSYFEGKQMDQAALIEELKRRQVLSAREFDKERKLGAKFGQARRATALLAIASLVIVTIAKVWAAFL